MNLNQRLSVIIPTYNRAALLMRALRSVFAQTRPADEVIVVDDGSSDNTAGQLQEHFPQVRYLRQTNQGVSAARNYGIRQAKGVWLAFLDSDDEWCPKKLERQLTALQNTPTCRICHTNEIWIRHGKRANPMKKHGKYGGYIFRRCLPLCCISPSSVMLHRSLFDEVGLWDESLPACEDYDLWLRICCRNPVLYLDDLLIVKYGGHADQLSRQYWGLDRFRIRALEKIIQSGRLTPEDHQAAINTLIEKIDIYVNGAQKRGKTEEVQAYQKKRRFYLNLGAYPKTGLVILRRNDEGSRHP